MDDVALAFFTVVSVTDDFGSFTFTLVSVVACFPKPFGGAFGGGSNAQAGGGFVLAWSLAGSDFAGKSGGSGLGIAFALIFFFFSI